MIYSTFLFLDFDGVVHKKVPENSADIFRGLAVLSKVLRLFPPIGIVISSTWKQYPRDLEFAISQFPSGLRDAIVDKTPNLGGKRTRELEIITWMRSNAVLAMNTIVLDDEPNLFDELRKRLVIVGGTRGLEDQDEGYLEKEFLRIMRSS